MPDIILPVVFNNPNLDKVEQLIWSDDFERTDATVLGSTPVGNFPWSILTNTVAGTTVQGRVIGGKAGIGSSANGRSFAVVDAGVSDGRFTAKFDNGLKSTVSLMVLRATDVNNAWHVTVSGGFWQLNGRVAGTGNSPALFTDVTAVNGDVVTVDLLGPSITLKINGVVALTHESSFNQTATKFGFATSVTSDASLTPKALWDNFSLTVPAGF